MQNGVRGNGEKGRKTRAAQVRVEAAKELFAQAVDLVLQVGWPAGKRKIADVWVWQGFKAQSLWPGYPRFPVVVKTPSRQVNSVR